MSSSPKSTREGSTGAVSPSPGPSPVGLRPNQLKRRSSLATANPGRFQAIALLQQRIKNDSPEPTDDDEAANELVDPMDPAHVDLLHLPELGTHFKIPSAQREAGPVLGDRKVIK